jgi:hypothetical protein
VIRVEYRNDQDPVLATSWRAREVTISNDWPNPEKKALADCLANIIEKELTAEFDSRV